MLSKGTRFGIPEARRVVLLMICIMNLAPFGAARQLSGSTTVYTAQSLMVDFVLHDRQQDLTSDLTYEFNPNCARDFYEMSVTATSTDAVAKPTSSPSGKYGGDVKTCQTNFCNTNTLANPLTDTSTDAVVVSLANLEAAGIVYKNPFNHTDWMYVQKGPECEFWSGGAVTSSTTGTGTVVKAPADLRYECNSADLNGGNWPFKCEYTYHYAFSYQPIAATTVDEKECFVEKGSSANAVYEGFIASESFQLKGTSRKYSFTLSDGTGTRVKGVTVNLQTCTQQPCTDPLSWANVLDASSNPILDGPMDIPVQFAHTYTDSTFPKVPLDNFQYVATNGMVYGNYPTITHSYLHASPDLVGSKSKKEVDTIVKGHVGTDWDGLSSTADNFAGNDGDLNGNNIHVAPFYGDFSIVDAGTYRLHIAGTIKGNAGSSDVGFKVKSKDFKICQGKSGNN